MSHLTKHSKNAETISLDIKSQKKYSKKTKQIKKQLNDGSITLKTHTKKKSSQALAESRGLVYIGHIPHGFYEEEMKGYFSQFGKVTNVKVCRSRNSGKSKGYGFVEFSNPEVAKIAAETMNNYLMCKKRVVAFYVPFEKRPKYLFMGRPLRRLLSSKFRQARQVESKNKKIEDEDVEKTNAMTVKKLNSKLERLKKRGIEFNITPVNKLIPSTN
ncbi:hypothetical protein HHI36_021637 [Cryptolaemus montrouzieri]|uniref:RRM domain-containing protein n=1 Tax=Cryptolaemus montrouzieri TaxID=559131 RepID=A0ABD2MXC6_9CUCU